MDNAASHSSTFPFPWANKRQAGSTRADDDFLPVEEKEKAKVQELLF